MIKSVVIAQVDNGYIVHLNQPIGFKSRVFGTWLEMFTEMGSYFSEYGLRREAGETPGCESAAKDCTDSNYRRHN